MNGFYPMPTINKLSITELFNSPGCFPYFRFWCRLEFGSTNLLVGYWRLLVSPSLECRPSLYILIRAPLNIWQGLDLHRVTGKTI